MPETEVMLAKTVYNRLWVNRRNVLNGEVYLVLEQGRLLVDKDLRLFVQSGDRGDTVPYQLAPSSVLPPNILHHIS